MNDRRIGGNSSVEIWMGKVLSERTGLERQHVGPSLQRWNQHSATACGILDEVVVEGRGVMVIRGRNSGASLL